MYQRLEHRLARLSNATLTGGGIGLEKESLRLGPEGLIAQTPHPAGLGSALMHPHITTDYSEALLEFVTEPETTPAAALAMMQHIHQYVYQHLNDELLWSSSMPCVVDGETSIPIAYYGRSNLAELKHVYRRGLGYRYGKVMQVIAGIHFNYSVPEQLWPLYQDLEHNRDTMRTFIDDAYFSLIRNVQRYAWFLLYLFGASPAVCKSFLRDQKTSLQEYDASTLYLPYATSLRMSDIGYHNKRRCGFKVSYDSLQHYADDLNWAVSTPCLPYQSIKIKTNGEYQQLNANVLQIENEYYSIMRPKQPPYSGERPLHALLSRGVRYVELRSSDLSPFDPTGMNLNQLCFQEAFLLFCLLHDSPLIDERAQQRLEYNQAQSASQGRQPGLQLYTEDDQQRSLQAWALEICEAMSGVCELLDRDQPKQPYQTALTQQRAAVEEPELTPSAQILTAMHEQGLGFFHFAERQSAQHRDFFQQQTLSTIEQAYFDRLTSQSLQQQHDLEAADRISFDDYVQAYFQLHR